MTPARLVKLQCPQCQQPHWEIDHDFRGSPLAGQEELGYSERVYACPACEANTAGWEVKEASPPEFLLQPHDMYPMTQSEFDYWVEILETHFPDHPRLAELGRKFYPCTPEEAYARKHDVVEMRDQQMTLRHLPNFDDALMWLKLQGREDTLRFLHKDGGELKVVGPVGGPFTVACADSDRQLLAESEGVSQQRARAIIESYFLGDIRECLEELRRSNG
jgi:hypothetical protein